MARFGVVGKLAGSTKLLTGQASGIIYTYEALTDPNYNISASDLTKSSAKLMLNTVPTVAIQGGKAGFKERLIQRI